MIFKEKTIGEILAIEDKTDMVSELYNYLVEKSNDGEDLSKLTDIEKVFYFCQSLQLEVNSGGFHRFFWNASGNYTEETINALKNIKANDIAQILEDASSKFPGGKASNKINERQDFMNDDPTPETDDWESFDQRFFTSSDNLLELSYNYVIANKDNFQ